MPSSCLVKRCYGIHLYQSDWRMLHLPDHQHHSAAVQSLQFCSSWRLLWCHVFTSMPQKLVCSDQTFFSLSKRLTREAVWSFTSLVFTRAINICILCIQSSGQSESVWVSTFSFKLHVFLTCIVALNSIRQCLPTSYAHAQHTLTHTTQHVYTNLTPTLSHTTPLPLHPLSAGGYGYVFIAQDPKTGKEYALKVHVSLNTSNSKSKVSYRGCEVGTSSLLQPTFRPGSCGS